ncbi:3-hydroxyacyl-CoA dehydrogenase NAD-binding domain-containing protein [Defluviimonas sp. WL0002]|uniref:3-hydroxyacyl-CoA dehydrogenase NAD-binding domain-containing protein n=1 Tax=Albidovulum marisflavi TaxID=2984159 RepID=A0ABT2ZBJ8_9RHOB|nr:3-hydroxyacyl-CoA dehydrogenase NAD-binding domain-containing protein [Defluviimonas sp. WL0002]MCV2868489.1 3-hydroxyacyl-CoA dehydrogenase NAD-binding domain-containing protein [Defluviimonas sp. WL0002]
MTKPRIGIAGLGTMGLGIAQVFASAGFSVVATDAQALARENARDRMASALGKRVEAGKLSSQARDDTLSRLTIVAAPEDLTGSSLVIEAIIEDMVAKRALFAQIEPALSPEAVLATNTSSLPVGGVAQGLTRPGRLLALHFFNPAPAMKLVELAGHADTDGDAIALARRLTEAAGKTVIDCPDRPGFIVNRCARPYYGEALALQEEGRSPADIDAAMLAAGYRLGPFSLIDLVGADVNLAATRGMWTAMDGHPRYHVFDSLIRQVQSGALGRKAGRGFLFPDAPGAPPADAQAIVKRIESTLINEAGWLFAEGGVTPDGIDTAMRLGLNFPYGPFAALQRHGRDSVLETLAALETAAPAHLAGRYRPAPIVTGG